MTEVFFPSQLKQATSTLRYIDATGLIRGAYTGAVQTTAYGGDRIGATINIAPVGMAAGQGDRAVLRAFLAALKGKQGRLWLRNDSYQQRGSFPSAELLSNNTFANGTTGWTGSNCALSVSDRALRLTRNIGNAFSTQAYQAYVGTQYVPYVARAMLSGGSFAMDTLPSISIVDNAGSNTEVFVASAGFGLKTAAVVPSFTDLLVVLGESAGGAQTSGAYIECSFSSLSRCLLADNGANSLIASDDQSAAAWSSVKLSVRSPNTVVAPDGTTTGTVLIEDGTAGARYVSQSGTRANVAADLCAYGYIKRGASGARNVALNIGNDLSNGAFAVFDLGAGTVAAPTTFGSGFTNARAFISSVGNNWYFCTVIARAPAAATILSAVQFVSGASTLSYTGDNSSSLDTWRCGAAVSSVPTRGSKTIGTALSSGVAQTGGAIYVKGLPVSTNGLLLAGDWVQVGKQIVMVTASLNSDAAGLGYLQFSPPLRTSPADNDPVIVNQPMGKFIFSGQFPEWLNQPGTVSSASLDLEESCD